MVLLCHLYTIRISIHAPSEGGDCINNIIIISRFHFNPRPQRRGRRGYCDKIGYTHNHFNPRPQRRGRQSHRRGLYTPFDFNPRPQRRGRRVISCTSAGAFYFNPRPQRRGRLLRSLKTLRACIISIHAPSEGGDFTTLALRATYWHFNPRPQRRGRLEKQKAPQSVHKFQSTPPAKGATYQVS